MTAGVRFLTWYQIEWTAIVILEIISDDFAF